MKRRLPLSFLLPPPQTPIFPIEEEGGDAGIDPSIPHLHRLVHHHRSTTSNPSFPSHHRRLLLRSLHHFPTFSLCTRFLDPKTMSRVEVNWDRLVRAALRRDRGGADAFGRPITGIAGNVPAALANRDIDAILRAADEIQDEDANVARILCEHAYSLAQNLDPDSEGRGVLQFKTGLMSVIKQKLAKRDGGTIDRSQDILRLLEFYKRYREKHKVDELREDEMKMRESGIFSGNLGELERKTVRRRRVFVTLKVLGQVVEELSKDIPEELKRVMESDAALSEDIVAYNIIPLDAPTITNPIVSFPEVKSAMSALSYFRGLPALPESFPILGSRSVDMLDFLQFVFGFQKDNVANQREHIVHLLANEQSLLGIPDEVEPKMDEAAVQKVFQKSLDNYIKWCNYLVILPVWNNSEAASKEKKLLWVSLYYLIWGEAANVRFMPECLCYIFHNMTRELEEILRQQIAQPAGSCKSQNEVSFLDQVISPLYNIIAAEAANNDNGRAPHSRWRNYDDFNEYFWSFHCFDLGWPWRLNSSFFMMPKTKDKGLCSSDGGHQAKTSFVEHRTFLHLYHSFDRLWIFLAMMLQGLVIIAFNEGKFEGKTVRLLLSLAPTFVVMKFVKCLLDILMMYGAFSTTWQFALSRIFIRFAWFGVASFAITYLYVRALMEENDRNSSVLFKIYIFIIGIYAAVHLFVSFLMRIPACHSLTGQCDQWPVIRFLKWMHQEQYYVGHGLYEKTTDFLKYMLFWLVVLSAKFAFAYFLLIKPLVEPTRDIIQTGPITYSWHDFVSKNNHNALTVASLWAPVIAIYLLDIHVFYTVISAVIGFLLGARDRLGEIRSVEAVHKLFERFPEAFMDILHVSFQKRDFLRLSGQAAEKNRVDAAKFAPFWNEIIKNLREEDYVSNLEMELLLMPKNTGTLPMVQWPLFLLASKIFLARDIAVESKDTQGELWDRISRDDYMKYAVEECYHSIRYILMAILDNEGRMWVERVFEDIKGSLMRKDILADFQLSKLPLVITRITALTGILKEAETPELAKGAVKAVQDLYDVVRLDILSLNMRDHYETWNMLSKARTEGRLFSMLNWPKDAELKAQVKRLHSLLSIKDSAANIPKNLEARRRLEFFTNSLFMEMPTARPVREMLSFSVFTPYYSEIVLYSVSELLKKNEDGISLLFYLQKIFPDEWRNFLARIGRDENALDSELFESQSDILELRFWASYRGQTLGRTVRGMMYYRKALMLQSYLEKFGIGAADSEAALPDKESTQIEGFDLSPEARAQADLKFTYVVTCQIYGKQKEEQKPEAADILLLMQKNEALRIAFIDVVEILKEGKSHAEYYSKLVKADIHGKDKEIYSIKLPGNPKLGEGKPENQNHAIIFTRGNAVQTIDMNQDNYFEEALKMRNLLEEFHRKHGLRQPSILGVREHVFTGSVSSLALFMSNQETSFVTLGQRVLAKPLKVRMHYGHPDVFDRIFHITRGGISKASRIINISEDIYSGFNSTLRQGNVTHHEYIQVGKGRDVGLNQIALFEGKVAGGNGEQVLSRDVYRLGQHFDFFRMLSFYYTTVGFYFCTMLTVLTVYVFLYGKAYLALSGVGETIQTRASILDNTALSAALNTQFLFQIGVFTAIPMILGFILEQGFLKAVVSFITMQIQLCSVFFTFSLGTRTHYFGRTILHGGARYQATGRGFVVRHIKFSENYRLYSRSHFVKGLEVVLLLVVFLAYGYNEGGALAYVLVTVSSWFMALSWLFAPYMFNPSGFEWQKIVEDFKDWTNWLLYRGGIGVKGEESWEAWWDEELSHIRTLRGRILETILSLRFFIFQYGVVYKMHVSGDDTRLTVYGFSWVVLAVIIILFKVFTFSQKASVNFQLVLRFVQGVSFMLALGAIATAVAMTSLSLPDVFASILAFVPTGWGILSIAAAWKPLLKKIGMWKSIRALARLYDAGMGMIIFVPIAICSWFPFISTFQTRLLYNQAFSRGLEISLILAGNNPNSGL